MENKVKVYVFDITNKQFDVNKLHLLEEKRRDNILLGRNYLYKLRSLYAGLLLRHALIAECGEISTPLEVEYNEFGKPYVNDGKHFSITHSGNIVMVAVADFDVGLDAEIVQNKVYSHIYQKVLSERELKEYSKLSGMKMSEYFLAHWVAKEAYLKYKGMGIRKFPSDVDVTDCLVNEIPYELKRFTYKNHDYFAAVATGDEAEVDFVYVKAIKAV